MRIEAGLVGWRRARARARRGMALAVVFLLLVVLIAFVAAWAGFRWSATRDTAADQLSLQALALAGSVADEIAARFGRAGNDPDSPVFHALRLGAGGERGLVRGGSLAGDWRLPAPAEEALFAAGWPASETVMDRLPGPSGFPRFDVAAREIRFRIHEGFGAPHVMDVRGEFQVEVRVRGHGPDRSLDRSTTRRQGFRLSRLGLPYPYDSLGFFARDSWTAMDRERAVRVGRLIHQDLDVLERGLAPVFDQVADMRDVATRLARVEDEFRAPDHGVFHDSGGRRNPRPGHSVYSRPDHPRIDDLAAWTLGGIALRSHERVQACRRTLLPVFRALERGDLTARDRLEPALLAYLDAAEAYRSEIQRSFEDRVYLDHRSASHRQTFDPGLAVLADFAAWQSRAWYRLESMDEFHAMFGPGGSGEGPLARNGIVHLAPPSGSVTLTGGSVWGASSGPGRLVILVDGDADVRDLVPPPSGAGLVTLVVRGRLRVSGTAQVCLVALGGLQLAADTTITGNVIHLAGPIDAAAGVRLRRDDRIRTGGGTVPPRETLYHLALDPSLQTVAVE